MTTQADLDNAVLRGDIQFDRAESLQKEVDKLQEVYDLKCDAYRELILLSSKMRKLLSDKGIENGL
jgi:hypothetical protein